MTMDITVDDLTKGIVEGTGVFDVLMRAVDAHLESQFKKQQITGAEYSNVYLGSLQTCLQTAVQFHLNGIQLEKNLQLVDQQIATQKEQVLLVKEQVKNVAADTLLKTKQLDLVDAQIAEAAEQLKLITAQITAINKDNEVKDAQIAKLQSDKALTDEQLAKLRKEVEVMDKQMAKLDADIALSNKRVEVETAQIEGTVDTVGGLIGKQMKLIDKQAEGFDRNNEQKAAKMFIDTWGLRQSTDGADVGRNGLNDDEINKVLNKLKQGLGLAEFVAPPPEPEV